MCVGGSVYYRDTTEARAVQELLSQMSTLCLIAILRRNKREIERWEGEKGFAGRKGFTPNPLLSLPSLQGSEQLGEYNHRGNATGQADKRGLRAGLGRWWGLSVCQSIWHSVKITQCRGPTGAQDSRLTSFPMVKYEGEVK